ncbi:rod shape-determining protein MreC [Nitratifractor sp.]
MKSKLLLLSLLGIILFVLLAQNRQEIRGALLNLVAPLKTGYKDLTREIKSKSQSYLFQKEQIQKLTRENRVLRKYLLDQTHYLRQVAALYKAIPTLVKLPYKSVTLVDTVSYVKLNKFDEVLLSLPKKQALAEEHVYGLIQDEVVAGTAEMKNGVLYGYLLPNPKCRFGVFVGPKRHPGIAMGNGEKLMAVRFIPKWADIKKGDRVETSGLDRIFFANIPVGIVKKVLIEGGYKTAYIETYADTLHPKLFFLITDPRPYLASSYDQNSSFPDRDYPYAHQKKLTTERNISSVPQMLQTQELEINPDEFEIPKEPEPTPEKKTTPKSLPSPQKKSPKARREQTSPRQEGMPTPENRSSPKPEEPMRKKHPSPFDILNTTRL